MIIKTRGEYDHNQKRLKVLHIQMDAEGIHALKKILNRALNTWPEAPEEFKELSDMLEHGRVPQEYNR